MHKNKLTFSILLFYLVLYVGYCAQYGLPKTIQDTIYTLLCTGLLGASLIVLCITTLTLFGFPVFKIFKRNDR